MIMIQEQVSLILVNNKDKQVSLVCNDFLDKYALLEFC